MIGAPYEFDRENKTKDFSLFFKESEFTDDLLRQLPFLVRIFHAFSLFAIANFKIFTDLPFLILACRNSF